MLQPRTRSVLFAITASVAVQAERRFSSRQLSPNPFRPISAFGVVKTPVVERSRYQDCLVRKDRLRGGSTEVERDDESEGDSDDASENTLTEITAVVVEDEAGTEEEDEEQDETPKTVSGKPVSVTIKTATGSRLLDQSIELQTVNRNRNVASLKKTVSRQLPSRPPAGVIQLTLHGKLLSDDTLVDDLVDDDDDEEEEEGEGSEGLVLHLDMIPTVDPKFIGELEKKIPDMTVSELLEAYAINEAALFQNAALLLKEDDVENKQDDENQDVSVERQRRSVLVNAQIREHAARIKGDLESTILRTEQAQALLAETQPPSLKKHLETIEVKGQRVRRVGASGVKGSWKRAIQHNLNVDWSITIRHFLLFLFFGWFGGRTATSRAILLLGAPSVFLLQARPVKLLLRQALYTLLDHPPGILLSLLPAPQQAILSLNVDAAIDAMYGAHIVSASPLREGEKDDLRLTMHEDDDDDDEEDDVFGSVYDSDED